MIARKVAYLTPLYFDESSSLGGGERYPLNIARGIVAASEGAYRVDLISFGSTAIRKPLADGVDLVVLPSAGDSANPLDVVSWDLPATIAQADLVHLHQARTRCSEMGVFVARQQGKPICVTDHAGDSSALGTEISILNMTDQIIAYSDFGASLVSPTDTPIRVVKGGADADFFTPTPASESIERDRILFVGRVVPHKGVDRLIAALPEGMRLTICGQLYHKEYLRQLHWLGRDKHVEYVEDADDQVLRQLYRRAWATVLPSLYQDMFGHCYQAPELMGLTLLESMACGTPAICSRVGAMPEFVRDGITGFIYDEVEQLNALIVRLAGDPELVERVGRAGRRTVVDQFANTVAGAGVLAVYESLLANRREVAA